MGVEPDPSMVECRVQLVYNKEELLELLLKRITLETSEQRYLITGGLSST